MLTSEEQLREFRWCASSFRYFLERYFWVRLEGGTRFKPWAWQREQAEALSDPRRFQRVLMLKARQIGMSWQWGAAYPLWTAMFHPGADVLLMSQTADDAKELLEKLRFAFYRLPEWLRPETGRNNTEVLSFPRLHSSLYALPSSKKAGRGFTGRLVVADEHAHHDWAEANLAAIDPAIEAGGQFLSLSTANGLGNLFCELAEKSTERREWISPSYVEGVGFTYGDRLSTAVVPEGAWLPLFLPYGVRPGRDAGWWERKAETYPRSWMIHQEYPRDPEEAFVQSGRPVWPKELLDRHALLCAEPVPEAEWPEAFRGWSREELRVWSGPVKGHRYVAGADVAEGLERGDYSDLSVFDVDAGERPVEVLSLHGHWEPDEFGRRLDRVARLYPGIYGVERNNHGLTVLVACRGLGTPGLYREKPVLTRQGAEVEPGKLGWLTTAVTKPLMIDELGMALRNWGVELRDRRAVHELVGYQTLKDGSTGAPAGKHDDRVMSRSIAIQMLKQLPGRVPAQPGTSRPAPILGGRMNL